MVSHTVFVWKNATAGFDAGEVSILSLYFNSWIPTGEELRTYAIIYHLWWASPLTRPR